MGLNMKGCLLKKEDAIAHGERILRRYIEWWVAEPLVVSVGQCRYRDTAY